MSKVHLIIRGKDSITYETDLVGNQAAEEAYHMTNAPLDTLHQKHIDILADNVFHGEGIATGDQVEVIYSPEFKEVFTCLKEGWSVKAIKTEPEK